MQKIKTIEVTHDANEGKLNAYCDEDHTLNSNTVRWDRPITASTDSIEVANAVTEINGAEIISVDHDKDIIFVHVNGDVLE